MKSMNELASCSLDEVRESDTLFRGFEGETFDFIKLFLATHVLTTAVLRTSSLAALWHHLTVLRTV